MGPETTRALWDIALWVSCIVAIPVLASIGLIESPEIALAAGALWVGIRARSKADVSTVRKSENQEG